MQLKPSPAVGALALGRHGAEPDDHKTHNKDIALFYRPSVVEAVLQTAS